MHPLISIIIPVYNVAPYVENCLKSVARQKYKNLEIIFVDDCGSDNSMEIIRSFCSSYTGNFVLLKHERNRGLSAARNTGVRAATGDYLFFLDSDDELSDNAMLVFVEYLNKYGDADFLIGNYAVNGNFHFIPLSTPEVLEGTENIIQAYIQGKCYMMAWGKLINRDFFQRNNLWFAENRLHEDELFSFQLALVTEKMVTVQEKVYKYIIHNGSITMAKKEKNYIDMYWIIFRKIELISHYKEFLNIVRFSYIISMLFGYFISVSISTLAYRKKYILLKWVRAQLRTLDRQNFAWNDKLKYYIFFLPSRMAIGTCKLIYESKSVYVRLYP